MKLFTGIGSEKEKKNLAFFLCGLCALCGKKIKTSLLETMNYALMTSQALFSGCLLMSLSSGCGYRWQSEEARGERPSITIPFIAGDEDGLFTNEMARALASSGLADLRAKGGDYLLQITLLEKSPETIGFRKDRQKVDGKNKRNMVACEERTSLSVEVALIDSLSDEPILGPCQLTADIDFDYIDGDSYKDLTFVNTENVAQAVLPFSLGQLEPYESARAAAFSPLYAQLAQKIVDLISSGW